MARLTILGGAAIGGLFWLIAIGLYRKMAGSPRVERMETHVGDRLPADAIDGLLTQGKELLAPAAPFNVQPRIKRPADNQLVIEQSGMAVSVEAVRYRNQTTFIAVIDDTNYTRKFLTWFGAYVLILMPLVIGGVCIGLWHYVAPHPSEAARWQTLQVMQIVHVLWPPFLIYSMWKRQRSQLINAVSNLFVFAQASKGGDSPLR